MHLIPDSAWKAPAVFPVTLRRQQPGQEPGVGVGCGGWEVIPSCTGTALMCPHKDSHYGSHTFCH